MKVHCLQFKEKEINDALGLFVAVMIMNNTSGTNYGNQMSSEDLGSKKMLLPVADDGNPDYAYMEQYVKSMMLKKYE